MLFFWISLGQAQQIQLENLHYDRPALEEQPTTAHPTNRRGMIKKIEYEINQINGQTDRIMRNIHHLQRLLRQANRRLTSLKHQRDIKMRELHQLKQQSFTQIKNSSL